MKSSKNWRFASEPSQFVKPNVEKILGELKLPALEKSRGHASKILQRILGESK